MRKGSTPTQSQGLTDEFMCALINWFTQRLSNVDITLVQGLIVDFCYDKLLTEDWNPVIDFPRSLTVRKNSLVGYDSLMKILQKTETRLMIILATESWSFFSFDSDSPHGTWPLWLSSLVSDSAAIDHTSRDKLSRAFRVCDGEGKKARTLPTFRFYYSSCRTFSPLDSCSRGTHKAVTSRNVNKYLEVAFLDFIADRDIFYKN